MSVLVSHVLWTGDNFGLVSMTLLVRHSDRSDFINDGKSRNVSLEEGIK